MYEKYLAVLLFRTTKVFKYFIRGIKKKRNIIIKEEENKS